MASGRGSELRFTAGATSLVGAFAAWRHAAPLYRAAAHSVAIAPSARAPESTRDGAPELDLVVGPRLIHAAAEVDDGLLLAAGKLQPVHDRGCDQEDRGEKRAQQRGEVELSLEVADRAKALVERCHEQKGEEHLHARERDAKLAQKLVQVAVIALELGLAAPVERHRLAAVAGLHLGGLRQGRHGGKRSITPSGAQAPSRRSRRSYSTNPTPVRPLVAIGTPFCQSTSIDFLVWASVGSVVMTLRVAVSITSPESPTNR